ncbi:MAG: metallophosphoesterase [Ardenticatenales bacterium]|nr:metallophosphoesterase [Ardenticatenales bacterium]
MSEQPLPWTAIRRRRLDRIGQRIAVRRFAGSRALAETLDRPLRIAHLTDLHVGTVTPHAAQLAAIEAVNAAEPDLVFLTGDYVCHSLEHLDELHDALRRVAAPMVGVLGNHDHWCGAPAVRRALEGAGVDVLVNETRVLEIGGQRLQIVGVDDGRTGHADVEHAVRDVASGLPTIGLSHVPHEADALWEHGVSLVLSGHTHSGQVAVGRMNELFLAGLGGHRYIHGLYGDRWGRRFPGAVYVSAGIGAAVMAVRMGDRARREVALFELGALPGDFDEHHAEQDPRPVGRALAQAEWELWRSRLRGGWLKA